MTLRNPVEIDLQPEEVQTDAIAFYRKSGYRLVKTEVGTGIV